jgi:hypothetical protein
LNRLEPNALLALSAAFALLLVVLTTAVYGPTIGLIRNPLLAIICAGGFLLLNPVFDRMMKRPLRPPLISARNPSTAAWAALFPMMILICAAVPVFWPGRDYGLLVIIAAVFFGATAESALKARNDPR